VTNREYIYFWRNPGTARPTVAKGQVPPLPPGKGVGRRRRDRLPVRPIACDFFFIRDRPKRPTLGGRWGDRGRGRASLSRRDRGAGCIGPRFQRNGHGKAHERDRRAHGRFFARPVLGTASDGNPARERLGRLTWPHSASFFPARFGRPVVISEKNAEKRKTGREGDAGAQIGGKRPAAARRAPPPQSAHSRPSRGTPETGESSKTDPRRVTGSVFHRRRRGHGTFSGIPRREAAFRCAPRADRVFSRSATRKKTRRSTEAARFPPSNP